MRIRLRRWLTGLFILWSLMLLAYNFYSKDTWRTVNMPRFEVEKLFINEPENKADHAGKFHKHIIEEHPEYLKVGPNGTIGLPTPAQPKLLPPKWDRIMPDADEPKDDRILAQMKLVPDSIKNAEDPVKLKKILVYSGLGRTPRGQQKFIKDNCPVQNCTLTTRREEANTADAIIFMNNIQVTRHARPPNQIWILYFLESPYHTQSLSYYQGEFNWTATYRHDSTIVAPYEKFVPYNYSALTKPQSKNYAAGKTKKVAWFVSNCGARNGRMQYAKELAKHIDVDIYGSCGKLRCPKYQHKECFEMLDNDYKFYLSFENSNCRDYITEKFFVNGLGHDIIPIVMGAHPDDYRRAAPPNSYIHVEDFDSAKELAEYLHKLDQNDELYNEYFQWKGTGRTINTYFWCRLCAMVHFADENHVTWYDDIEKWWRGDGVCAEGRWKDESRNDSLIMFPQTTV